MGIEAKKQFFKQKGYCEFSIKDVDVDFYNFLEQNLICDSEKNLQNEFTQFRFDSNKMNIRFQSPDGTYETARLKKEELLADCDEDKLSQCWYFSNKIEHNDLIKIKKGIHNIIKYFYGFRPSSENDELQLSYYDNGCLFRHHSDGQTVNLCSIIIYLNKNYDASNGGLLLMNDGYVTPEFGQCALMDLSTHDIKHGVTKVTGGPGRYAILAFPKPLSIL
jgi:Rps23 Pro-64 3,4-dihydroxylase Tpa1-like proline 4-hydroxylase